jgi:long-chain fatty acid transport protein
MKRRNLIRILALAIPGLVALKASGNGFGLISQDAFASARGEAFVATADNASAIYYNPAGITQLEGNNLRAGIYGLYLRPSFTSSKAPYGGGTNTQTYYDQNNLAAVPQFFYTWTPNGSPISMGLGVYSPFGLSVRWPDNTGFNTVATEGALTYITINPVLAAKLTPTLSIGGGVMVNYGDIDMEQDLLRAPTVFTNYFRFKGSGWSVGYNLGALWQPQQKIAIGVSFRSSATIRMEGRTEFEQQPLPGLYPGTNRSAYADFTFPLSAVVGLSYRPTPKWNLEFDANYTDWSSLGKVDLHQKSPPFPLRSEEPIRLYWESSWIFELGATRYFDKGWHVSAGYVFNQNSVPNDYYSPLVADMDRHFFTVGAGLKGKTISFDVAYQFGYGPTHTVTGSTPSLTPTLNSGQNADGKYDFISHAVIVTAGVHF